MSEHLATRLVLLGACTAVTARAMLEVLPRVRRDLLPWSVLGLLLIFGGAAWALPSPATGSARSSLLSDVRSSSRGRGTGRSGLRRPVGALDLASDISVESMLAGGLVALLLLPAAVALQRCVRRLVYGDRDFPRRVVSDLRSLDPLAASEDALRETLELLTRRLHLSFAAIEVFARPTPVRSRRRSADPRDTPVTVDLAVGGTALGRLRLEVDPARPLRTRRPPAPRGRRHPGRCPRPGGHDQPRAPALPAAPDHRPRGGASAGSGVTSTTGWGRPWPPGDAARGSAGPHRGGPRARGTRRPARGPGAGGDHRGTPPLVDGLRPPALDQLGLVSALRQRPTSTTWAGRRARSGPPNGWSVEATDDVEPLPAAVEVAAYRIVVEAVTNASGTVARTCGRAPLAHDALRVQITDAGRGTGRGHGPGCRPVLDEERARSSVAPAP